MTPININQSESEHDSRRSSRRHHFVPDSRIQSKQSSTYSDGAESSEPEDPDEAEQDINAV